MALITLQGEHRERSRDLWALAKGGELYFALAAGGAVADVLKYDRAAAIFLLPAIIAAAVAFFWFYRRRFEPSLIVLREQEGEAAALHRARVFYILCLIPWATVSILIGLH